MADICLVLKIDPTMIDALDKLARDDLGSRTEAAISVLQDWLVATGYLDEDKPFQFRSAPEDDCG